MVVVLVVVVVVGAAVVVVVGAAVVVVVVGAAVVVVVGARVEVGAESASLVVPAFTVVRSAALTVGRSFRSPAWVDASSAGARSGADTAARARASGTVVEVSSDAGSNTPPASPLVDISDAPPLQADAKAASSRTTRSVRQDAARVNGAGIAPKHRRVPPIP